MECYPYKKTGGPGGPLPTTRSRGITSRASAVIVQPRGSELMQPPSELEIARNVPHAGCSLAEAERYTRMITGDAQEAIPRLRVVGSGPPGPPGFFVRISFQGTCARKSHIDIILIGFN